MSRIGKKPIPVPAGVKVSVAGLKVTVEGPKGSLVQTFPEGVTIAHEAGQVKVGRASDQKRHRAFHGLTRALIANMVQGVKEPFSRVLEVHGTGFAATVTGMELELDIGFSNKVKVAIPKGLEVTPTKGRPTLIAIKGPSKQLVGQFAATIRNLRPPSPYGDNKGIRYQGEVIRKKAGKAFGEKK